jgi:hypothetical protein
MVVNRDPRFQLIEICLFFFFIVHLFFFVVPNLAGLIVSDLVHKNRKSPAAPAPRGHGEAGATSRRPPFGSYTEPPVPMEPPWRCTQHAARINRKFRSWTRAARVAEAPAPLRLRPHQSSSNGASRTGENLCRARQAEMVAAAASPGPAQIALPRARNRLDSSERALEPFCAASSPCTLAGRL